VNNVGLRRHEERIDDLYCKANSIRQPVPGKGGSTALVVFLDMIGEPSATTRARLITGGELKATPC
jgi:hypothetical protein